MWVAYYLTPDGEKPLGEYESKREAELAVVERYSSKLNDELKKREKKSQKSVDAEAIGEKRAAAAVVKEEAAKTEESERPESRTSNDKAGKPETLAHQRQDEEDNANSIRLRFNPRNDKDILKKLESVSNKQTYIKELIRQDINKKSRK